MDVALAVTIVGSMVVLVGAVLIWRSQSRGDDVHAGVSVAELFSVELRISSAAKAEAQEAVRQADEARGVRGDDARGLVEDDVTLLARVLWIDDNPDNNRFEVVALERLGKLVLPVPHSSDALFYLDSLSFDVVITDVSRPTDRLDGIGLIREIRRRGLGVPVVVYTGSADEWEREALDVGADAVVDLPGELVRAVVGLTSEVVS